MNKNLVLLLTAFSISGFTLANESLPVQKIQQTETVLHAQEANPAPATQATDTLTDIERANISDIANKKVEFPQFEMGMRYYTGSYGLTVDYDKAIYWFSNSSQDEANPKADMMLAAMYYQGKGFKVDKQKAMNFYNRAANRNLLDAQLILTGLYFFNEDLMNQEYANYWIYKAISNSSEVAETLKTLILFNNDDLKTIEKMMPMYTLLAKKKDANANFIMGYLYFTGKGVAQDFEKAKSYLTVAAQNNNPVAIIMIEEITKFENTAASTTTPDAPDKISVVNEDSKKETTTK